MSVLFFYPLFDSSLSPATPALYPAAPANHNFCCFFCSYLPHQDFQSLTLYLRGEVDRNMTIEVKDVSTKLVIRSPGAWSFCCISYFYSSFC